MHFNILRSDVKILEIFETEASSSAVATCVFSDNELAEPHQVDLLPPLGGVVAVGGGQHVPQVDQSSAASELLVLVDNPGKGLHLPRSPQQGGEGELPGKSVVAPNNPLLTLV